MPRNSRNERPSGDRRSASSRPKSASPYKSSRPSSGGFRKKDDDGSREDKPRFGGSKPNFRKSGSFERNEDRGERKSGGPFKKSFDKGAPRGEKPFGKSARFEDKGERKGPYKKSFDKGDSESRFSKNRFTRQSDEKPFRTSEGSREGGDDRRASSRPYTKRAEGAEGKPFRKKLDRNEGDDTTKRAARPFSKPSSRPFGESRFTKKGPYQKRSDTLGEEGAGGEVKRAYSGKYERKGYGGKRKGGPSKKEQQANSDSDIIRLNKYISNSGVCSRREADDLIKMGLVTVNGQTITEMGYKVKRTDEVRYEGKRLKAEKPVYILVNKPKGFITTTDDPQDRNTVMHLIGEGVKERVYPVGRLDRNTTGLLLLTNDGDLADKLTHPSYNVKKIYKVELDKPITKADFQKVVEGVRLEEGKAVPDDVAIVGDDAKTIGIELHIGWNRIVRRIFESLEYEVVKLDRVVYAGLDKKNLGRGEWRFLKEEEIVRLKHLQ